MGGGDRKVGDLGLEASAAQTPYPLEGALSLGFVTTTEDFICEEGGMPRAWATPKGGVWSHF